MCWWKIEQSRKMVLIEEKWVKLLTSVWLCKYLTVDGGDNILMHENYQQCMAVLQHGL